MTFPRFSIIGAAIEGGALRRLLFFTDRYGPSSKFEGKTMAKPATIKIRLNSTADTGHFYVTKKNPRNHTEKFTFRKYDPIAKKHVEYKEGKIK